MTTFRFNGHKVTVDNGKLHSDDKLTQSLLAPMVGGGSGGPEEGDPFLKFIISVFGIESVTDVVNDDPPGTIY